MNDCPCCYDKMLRQISHKKIYWYCPSCHQEMPNFQLFNQLRKITDKKELLLS